MKNRPKAAGLFLIVQCDSIAFELTTLGLRHRPKAMDHSGQYEDLALLGRMLFRILLSIFVIGILLLAWHYAPNENLPVPTNPVERLDLGLPPLPSQTSNHP
jgi:hypothetical protein